MANPQDEDVLVGRHRLRRPRHPRSPSSPTDPRDWEGTQQPVVDSLPYRPRATDIEMPDSRTPEHLSSPRRHHRRRASEDMRARESILLPPLARSASVTHRRGRDPRVYEDGEPSSSERRPRARRRARTPSPAGSERSSSRSDVMLTPPRSARVNHSTPESRRSSRSSTSRRTPSVESASSLSTTQGEVKQILRRRGSTDIEVIPDTVTPGHRRNRKKHRGREPPLYEEETTRRSRRAVPVAEGSDLHRRRHRHHSGSRSSSHRNQQPQHHPHHHHHHHHHNNNNDNNNERRDLVRPASDSKRRNHRKYYASDSVYLERPKPARSASSHVTSAHSVSTSSRRSTIISTFLGPALQPRRPLKLVECVACMDEEMPSTKTGKLKCGHRMCHSCMKRLFKISIKDPQSMPPKCCEDPIAVKHVDRLFDISFKKTWNRKFAEFSTRNRIYCPSRRCGEWIKPDRIQKLRDGRRYAKCGHCKTEVCCVCNGKWHRSTDCPQDEATNVILQQASEHGWQRCYSCREMVELKEGCNHMTCRCGSEFCMICGAKWKSCECPWFNYNAAEPDVLEHTQDPFTARSERDRLSIREARGHSTRHHPQAYEGEITSRRVLERRDESVARPPQHDDLDDDDDDDYVEGYGAHGGMGHYMNEDYRRPRVKPAAPSPPMAAVDRANSGDYVSGVNRARGVRGSSMDRLADRFSESRQGNSPIHRGFTHVMAPPPGMAMGAPPPPPPPPPMGPLLRRHTLEDELYGGHARMRLGGERIVIPGRARADYEAEAAIHAPHSRRRPSHPKDSAMAGLTGPGSGMNRVSEWRNHVAPGNPDVERIVAS